MTATAAQWPAIATSEAHIHFGDVSKHGHTNTVQLYTIIQIHTVDGVRCRHASYITSEGSDHLTTLSGHITRKLNPNRLLQWHAQEKRENRDYPAAVRCLNTAAEPTDSADDDEKSASNFIVCRCLYIRLGVDGVCFLRPQPSQEIKQANRIYLRKRIKIDYMWHDNSRAVLVSTLSASLRSHSPTLARTLAEQAHGDADIPERRLGMQ